MNICLFFNITNLDNFSFLKMMCKCYDYVLIGLNPLEPQDVVLQDFKVQEVDRALLLTRRGKVGGNLAFPHVASLDQANHGIHPGEASQGVWEVYSEIVPVAVLAI